MNESVGVVVANKLNGLIQVTRSIQEVSFHLPVGLGEVVQVLFDPLVQLLVSLVLQGLVKLFELRSVVAELLNHACFST